MSARRMDQAVVNNHGAFIWRIANLLRGTYKPTQYLRADVGDYVRCFSPNVRDIFEPFELDKTLANYAEAGRAGDVG